MAKAYVVDGARLKCSLGVAPSKLVVLPDRTVELTGKREANVMDCKITNIIPFGACKITSPPKPCTPACVRWLSGKQDNLIQGQPALLNSDKVICMAGGGIIEITDCGQGAAQKGAKKVTVKELEFESPNPPTQASDSEKTDAEANTPIDGNKGNWTGARGDSVWKPDRSATPEAKSSKPKPYNNPDNLTWGEILDKYEIEGIPYVNGEPDFNEVIRGTGSVNIEEFTDDRRDNFRQADIKMAEAMTEKLERPVKPAEVKKWRDDNGYTWHECRDQRMEKVPHEIHGNVSHSGGVSAYKNKAK